MTKENLLSTQEAAQILNVSRRTVSQWAKKGVLNPVRIGDEIRFHPENVRAVFEGQRIGSPEPKKRILVIDDDLLVGESLKNLLEKAGFDAAVVSIGLAALDLASRETFDLIIADVRMPGMNGIETLKAIRELRSRFGKPLPPEIILTAYDDKQVREEAQRMSVFDFILKPFELESFLASIRKSLVINSSNVI